MYIFVSGYASTKSHLHDQPKEKSGHELLHQSFEWKLTKHSPSSKMLAEVVESLA